MSTFYTAPPIYNTGGWGFRGDIPTFNPTGVLDDVGETGKVSVSSSFYHVSNEDRRFKITTSTSDIQYFTKENRRDVNLEIDPTFNLNNLITPRVDFQINPSFKSNYLISPRIDFEIKPNIQNSYKISSRLNLDRQINLQHSSIAFIEGKTFVRGIEDVNYYSKSFIEGKNYNTTEANYYGKSFIRSKTFSQFGANYFSDSFTEGKNYLVLRSDYFPDDFTEGKSSRSVNINLARQERLDTRVSAGRSLELQNPYRIEGRLGLGRKVNINHAYNFSQRVGLSRSVGIDHARNFEKQKYSLSTSISYNPRNIFHRFKNTNTLSNLNYFTRDDFEGVFSANVSLNNIQKFRIPFYKGFAENRLSNVNYFSKPFYKAFTENRLSDTNYFSTSFERFSETNTLNRIDYNSDPVPKEAKTEPSFPTGVEFPKIRYQTAEPDYTKASTGSNTYGYLQYEGIEEGNLFFYEPDTGSYQWEYFHYGIRSGIFNPCEFPETADRTLDPVQISSRSNKKDNPYWYLPDLLTVDSTIHLADGAPCQYIAQENSRFAEIFLEDGLLLLPENYTNTGQLYTI
tara:strand:+ start:2132 stop:3838 length:1707 start_codon:yes stop_codon:yes gene_type:complete